MVKEFNLSEWIKGDWDDLGEENNGCIPEKEVKEFINRLKYKLSNPMFFDDSPIAICQSVEELINKLAGDKLTEKPVDLSGRS